MTQEDSPPAGPAPSSENADAAPDAQRTYALQAAGVATRGAEAVPDLVQLTLETAVELEASDVHFDPTDEGVRVLFRLGGILHFMTLLPGHLADFRRLGEQEGPTLSEMANRVIREGATSWEEVQRVLAGEPGLESEPA